jgi:hypothetical protein
MPKDARGEARREREFYRKRMVDLFRWDSLELRLKSGRLLATVEPDPKWPKMYRVRLPDGHLTAMVNLTRPKTPRCRWRWSSSMAAGWRGVQQSRPCVLSARPQNDPRQQTRILGHAIESNEGEV